MRISKAHVEAKVENLNRLLSPTGTYDPNGVGTIELDGAYGGWAVYRISNEHRGVQDLMGGHQTLREAATFIDGMIAAARLTQEAS